MQPGAREASRECLHLSLKEWARQRAAVGRGGNSMYTKALGLNEEMF